MLTRADDFIEPTVQNEPGVFNVTLLYYRRKDGEKTLTLKSVGARFCPSTNGRAKPGSVTFHDQKFYIKALLQVNCKKIHYFILVRPSFLLRRDEEDVMIYLIKLKHLFFLEEAV